jgi:hypothetical protein
MPGRRSGAEEIGSTTPGGAAVGIHHESTDETTHYSQEDENIIGTMHSPVAGCCHPEHSYGS